MHSDDPETPKFTLTMKGSLIIDAYLSPPSLFIRDLEPGASGTAPFAVHLREDAELAIESVTVDGEGFSVKPIGTPGERPARYELRFAGASAPGNTRGTIRVKTTSADTPELTAPARAIVVADLRYSKLLSFVRRNGEFAPRTLRITARSGAAPKIKRLEDRDGLLELSVLPKEHDDTVVIQAKLKTAAYDALDQPARDARRTLVVHTSHREEPRIEVMYTVRDAPQPRRRPIKTTVEGTVPPDDAPRVAQ